MSTAVAMRPPAAEVEPVLSDLAERARNEHALALQAGESMLLHAVQSGEALLEAKAHVADDGWGRWLRSNFPASDRTAKQYMRIARGRERVLSSGVKTLAAAESLVPALSPGLHRQRFNVKQEEREAKEMHKEGASINRIAQHFDIAHTTAKSWVIPGFRKARNQRIREERRLAKRALTRRQSKKTTKAISELYATCERLQDVFGQCRGEATTNEARSALAAAEQSYREMRDAVVRAIGAQK